MLQSFSGLFYCPLFMLTYSKKYLVSLDLGKYAKYFPTVYKDFEKYRVRVVLRFLYIPNTNPQRNRRKGMPENTQLDFKVHHKKPRCSSHKLQQKKTQSDLNKKFPK